MNYKCKSTTLMLITMFLLIVLGLMGLEAYGSGEVANAPLFFTISGGSEGNFTHMLAAFIANEIGIRRPGSQVTAMAGGITSNCELVSEGVIDIGITSTNFYSYAVKGIDPFKKAYNNLRTIAELQARGGFQFIVRTDTGLTSVEQIIKEKYPLRLVTFVKGGGPEVNTRQCLEEYGITYDDIRSWGGSVDFMQWTDAVEYIRDGHAEAICGAVGIPNSYFLELSQMKEMRLLPIGQDQIDAMVKKYDYIETNLPAGLYGLVEEDMPTFGYGYPLFTSEDVSEDLIYAVTEVMYEEADRIRMLHSGFANFDPKKMLQDLPGELHPGAKKFYQEKGLIN